MRTNHFTAFLVIALVVSCGGGSDSSDDSAAAASACCKPAAQAAQAATGTQPAELDGLFTWAQARFPSLFPGNPGTASGPEYDLRYYPSSQLALATRNGGVYVMGTVTNNQPIFVGWRSSFPPMSPMWYRPVFYDADSSVSGFTVIRDANTLRTFWRQLAPSAPPDINFSDDMLVALMGRNSRGCGAAVDRVEIVGGVMRVSYVDGGANLCPNGFYSPAQVVAVPRFEGRVEFVRVTEVDWQQILRNPTGTWGPEFRTMVISDTKQWEAVWAERHAAYAPMPPVPSIDFARRMVVTVHLGQASWSCSAPAIPKIVESESALTVYYRESPPMGGGCPGVYVDRTVFATIPRTTKPVRFVAA
ncbi:hypothetical protein [Ramlibacter albus]|uniref:Uncharacterized protein n=1 Tax=Ramlibacter albus TaxID=2079448 RepID=A0A923S8H4_9BURK|nr:hypothetical protein [Ramlibacter albus]MBC5768097.1 hypothetical protein [Ramlibacter albus]